MYHVRVQLVDTLVQLSKRQATSHQFKVSKSRKRLQQVKKLQEVSKPLPAGDIVMGTPNTVANVQQLLETTSSGVIGDLDPVDHTQNTSKTTPFYCPFCM